MNPPRKSSSSRGAQEKETTPLSIDYSHLGRLCLKYWPWLVAGVVLGLVGGYFYAKSQIPIYSAQSSIVVNGTSGGPTGEVGTPDGISDDMIKTYEQLLQTKDLAERVVKTQHLEANPQFFPVGDPGPMSQDEATGILAGSMTIRIRPLTRLIDISVEHHDPAMAQMLANQLAHEAVAQYLEQHKGSGDVLAQYLQTEVDQLRQELTASESALKAYETKNNIIPAGLDAHDSTDQQLADLNKQLSAAEEQVTLLQERYLPQHPKLIAAEELVDELKTQLHTVQATAMNQSSDSSEYASLKSNVDSYQTQLTTMLKELNDAKAKQVVDIPPIAVAEEAALPYGPIRPNKPRLVAMGAFGGLVCGLGFILALYFMDNSVRTVAQAEATLGLPVIAAIPILTETEGRTVLPTFSDPQSFVAESFRGLRASLILHDRQHPLKTVLVVSAVPGEGKSFCAANLAVAFAQAGLKTLLIDADLRLPTAHTYFNVPDSEATGGFTEVLSGRMTLAAAVVQAKVPNLGLLLTTAAADAPAELLSGVRLPILLDEAAKAYDRVVIDSAPLNAVSDTMLILQKADAILLVVRAAQTPASECKAALQRIASSNLKPLGLILNHLAAHTLKSYAYGYSYGQKPPKGRNAK